MKMKDVIKLFLLLSLCAAVSSCGIMSAMSAQSLASAAGNVVVAASITDDQIAQLSKESVAYMDKQNKIDDGKYDKRLKTLMNGVTVEGLDLNFKVYETSEVNAFACGDGSIRVYSGLMDVMDDDELVAIIGHEIGHVVHKDTKAAMKSAYLAAAARDVVSASPGVIGTLSRSVAGDITQTFLNSQFSQKQEYAADEYGYEFAIRCGRDPYSMAKALEELVSLSGNASTSSAVAKMFSSHPDSAKRAEKVRAMADEYVKSQNNK